jgi:predicted PurR-regulated permease PerM
MVAQMQDAILVGLLWLIGLLVLDVPLAPLWAFLGALLQFIPNLGIVLSLIGPAFSAALSGGWMKMIYVLILYAGIVVVDALVLQPVLMKRNAKVPIWISIPAPIVLGLLFNVWGVVAAAPLLAIIFTYREKRKIKGAHPKDQQNSSSPPRPH